MNSKTHRLGLTTSEAARHLGVSLSTIRRWSDLGYLRGYRTPGGQRRFSTDQLDEFIASLESGSPLRQAPVPPVPDEPTFSPETAFRVERTGWPAAPDRSERFESAPDADDDAPH